MHFWTSQTSSLTMNIKIIVDSTIRNHRFLKVSGPREYGMNHFFMGIFAVSQFMCIVSRARVCECVRVRERVFACVLSNSFGASPPGRLLPEGLGAWKGGGDVHTYYSAEQRTVKMFSPVALN